MSDNQGSNFFKGLAFGSLVGFVAGVLLAPDKGENTRRKLKEKKDQLEPRLRDFALSFKNDLGPFFEGFIETAGDKAAQVKEVLGDFGSKISHDGSSDKNTISTPPPTAVKTAPTKRRFFKVNK